MHPLLGILFSSGCSTLCKVHYLKSVEQAESIYQDKE